MENYSYFSTKTYVVGTQKNHLDETVLLNTQNTCLNGLVRKLSQLNAQKLSFSRPMDEYIRSYMSGHFIEFIKQHEEKQQNARLA